MNIEAAGLQLVIDHQFRLGPGATTTAALLEEGAIGRLQTIRANFTKSRPAGWELGVTGTHVEIAGERRRAERRKRGDRILIEMRGPKGRLRLSGGAFDAVYLARGAYPEDVEHHIPWQPVALPARPERPTMSYMAATIAPVYEQLIRTIEHGEPHPCNGVGGRRAMEMISAIFASHFAGGRR